MERNGGGGKQRGIKYSPFVSKFRGISRLDFLGLLFLFEFCGRRIVVLSSSSSQNAAPKKVTSSLLLSHIGCFYTQWIYCVWIRLICELRQQWQYTCFPCIFIYVLLMTLFYYCYIYIKLFIVFCIICMLFHIHEGIPFILYVGI